MKFHILLAMIVTLAVAAPGQIEKREPKVCIFIFLL
jgi:hypothetical protein